MKGVTINGTFVANVDSYSGREASEYIGDRWENIPGGCSMTASYYGILPDGTEERIDGYTSEKIGDEKFYLRHAIRNIEEEKR